MSDINHETCVPLRDYLDAQTARVREATDLARVGMEPRISNLELKVRDLEHTRSELGGKASQRSATLGIVLGLLGALMALASFMLTIIGRQ